MMRVVSALVLTIPLLGFADEEKKPDVTVETLVKAARDVDTEDEAIRILQVEAEFLPWFWKVRALWKRSGPTELSVLDSEDETPIAFQSGTKLMIYDPEQGVLHRCRNVHGTLLVGASGDEFSFRLRFSRHDEEDESPIRLRFLLQSIATEFATINRKVTTLEDDRHLLLGRTERMSVLAMSFKLGDPYPVNDMVIRVPGQPRDPVAATLTVNEEIDDGLFHEIDFDALEEDFKVVDFEIPEQADELDPLAKLVLGAAAVRAGLRDAQLRGLIERSMGKKLNWETAAKQDEVLAPRLRDLFD